MKLVKCMNCATERYIEDNIVVAVCPWCIIQMDEILYGNEANETKKSI